MCPFRGGSLSNTMWPGPTSTSVPSGIFIHPAVWSQQTWAENWVGGGCAFFLGEMGPHLTQSRLPPYQVASQSMQMFDHNEHGPKIRGCAPLGRGAGSPSNTMSPGPRSTLRTKQDLDTSSHLATTDMGRKLGSVPLWEGDLGPHLRQCGQGRSLPACRVSL